MPEVAPAPVPAPPPVEYRTKPIVTEDSLLGDLGGDDFAMEESTPEPAAPARTAEESTPQPDELVAEAVESAAEQSLETPAEGPEPESEPAPAPDPWNGKGTRDAPLTLKDLPEDRFLKVKVDGETQLVNLREAVEGAYLRPQAFDRLLSKANAAKDEATRIARDAVDHQQRFRDGFEQWIRDPQKVFEMMLENHEEVLLQVAIKTAELRKAETEDPSLRHKRVYTTQQRKLAEERQRTQAERQAWEQQRAAIAARDAAIAVLKPGYDRALEELGITKVSHEMNTHIRALLRVVREQKGGPLSAEDAYEAVVRAGRYLASRAQPAAPVAPAAPPKPAVTPPATRPKPAAMATPRPAAPAPNGESKWDGLSQGRRFQDPDFFWPG